MPINILTTDNEIKTHILTQLQQQVGRKILKTVNVVKRELPIMLREAIIRQPAWRSLISGELKGHFGLPDPENRLSKILAVWLGSIQITPKPTILTGGGISAGLTVEAIREHYEDVFGLPEAEVGTRKGQFLPWLQWLLEFGDTAIVRDYNIEFGSFPTSRSKIAVMRKNQGGLWRVPPEFASRGDANFVTDAIDEIEDDLENLIRTTVTNA